MASDRKQLIRLASGMPTGDPARKAILAGLEKTKTPLVGSRRVGSVRFTLDADLPKGVERSFSRDLIKMIDANMWDYNKHNDAKRMAEWVEQEASKMLGQALQRSGLSEDEADNAIEDAWDGVQDSIGEYLLKSYEEAADQAEDDEPDIAENYRDEKEAIKRVFRAATSPMSDRKTLIRIAASLPKGDANRRVLLAELQKESYGFFQYPFKRSQVQYNEAAKEIAQLLRRLPENRRVKLDRDQGPYKGRQILIYGEPDWAKPTIMFDALKRIGYKRFYGDVYGKKDEALWVEIDQQPRWKDDAVVFTVRPWPGLSNFQSEKTGSNKQARGWDGQMEGPKVRAKWVRRGQFPYMEVQELPGKPFKRKLRKAEFRWSNHGQQWPLLMENVLEDARLSKNMDYDKVVRAMQNALKKIPSKYDEKTIARFGPMPDYVQKELARQPYEDNVFYLEVEPANYKDIDLRGRDFGGTSKWTGFKFYSDSDEYDQQEGMQAFTMSTSAGGARKLFKMLKANPDLVKNIKEEDFRKLLDKNKIGYRYVPTVWR
jgi:hypothetical protein